MVGGAAAQEGLVEILGEGAGADEQLAGQGAHDGSQDGSQQQASDPGVEQQPRDLDEDGLVVGGDGVGDLGVAAEVGDAEVAHADGTEQAEEHPDHADAAGVGDGVQRFGRHEAHEDVRLAEVAQTPGGQREDGQGVEVAHQAVGARLELFDDLHALGDAALVVDDHQRGHDQRGDHQRGLDGVRPADGQEAADEDVGNGAQGADPEGDAVGHAEHALEEAGARHDAGGAVQREEDEDDDRREDAQQVTVVLEAVGEVVGHGQRVADLFGVDAQAPGHQVPVEPGTDAQADGNPGLGQAAGVDGARQAHQQPAAHVGGAGREGGDEAAQAASAQDVVGQVAGGPVAQPADEQHGNQVDGKHDGGCRVCGGHGHGPSPCIEWIDAGGKARQIRRVGRWMGP